MKYLASFIVVIFFYGCSYKPSSVYVRNVLGNNIYTKINISAKNPESMPLVVDAINEAIVSKYKSKLTKIKEEADSVIVISNAHFTTEGLQKDENGYTVLFRTTAYLSVLIKTKDYTKRFKLMGNYDFAQTPDSILSEEKRLTSFKFATIKALDEITAKLAYLGSR